MIKKVEWKIPLFKMYSDKRDIEAVSKVLQRGMYWAEGPEIKEFERKFREFLGVKYALSFNSGTSALFSLLVANNIRKKEVIVPSFTFIATSNMVPLAGGRPIFAESEPETFGLDFRDVKNKINGNTKAIILIHHGGNPARDTKKIKKMAEREKILVIEDAAQAFGSKIDGKLAGTIGDGAIFSLCQSKIITTGEGGFAVTNSRKVFERMRLIRSHGRLETNVDYFSNTENGSYVSLGHNFRLPTFSAALGISQLQKFKKIKSMRIKNAEYLNKELSEIKEIRTPKKTNGSENIYQMYTILLKNKKVRDDLKNFMKDKGIMTKVFYNPIHTNLIYKKRYGYRKGDLPKTERIANSVLTLPMYPDLTKKQLDYITDSVKEFFRK